MKNNIENFASCAEAAQLDAIEVLVEFCEDNVCEDCLCDGPLGNSVKLLRRLLRANGRQTADEMDEVPFAPR